MIKLTVEWRSECPNCGTTLVADFFASSTKQLACPWCGLLCEAMQSACNDEIRESIAEAVAEIEERFNGEIIVQG
ncbi:MAG: hypothetical protein ABFD49_04330 [Armatimonadota bacterium]|nr:hypothetical protein [bacterium]